MEKKQLLIKEAREKQGLENGPARSRADQTRGSFLSIKMEHGDEIRKQGQGFKPDTKRTKARRTTKGSGINYQQASETPFTRELRKYSNDHCHEVCTWCPYLAYELSKGPY